MANIKYLFLFIIILKKNDTFPLHDVIHNERTKKYKVFSNYLSNLTDQEIEFLSQSNKSIFKVNNESIFIKKIPLTDLELEAKNIQNSANIFNLPLFYQYGIHLPLFYQQGMWSAGFGAWRELACCQWGTQAVLSGQCSHFVMLYHWRIVNGHINNTKYDTQEKINSRVAFWNHSEQVAHRLEALQKSSYFLVLFLEYIPTTLNDFLEEKIASNIESLDSALIMIQAQMQNIADYLRRHHFFHFDAHCNNFMTDQKNIYLIDFGLSTHLNLNISEEEKAFLQDHINFDEWYMFASLVDELAIRLTANASDAQLLIYDYSIGKTEFTRSKIVTQFLQKYASWAIARHDFFINLRISKFSPYPKKEIAHFLE